MVTQNEFLPVYLQELPFFRSILRSIEASFFQEFDLVHPILDVGCGDGHFAATSFRSKIDAGLDPSMAALKEAKSRDRYQHLVCAEGNKAPFPCDFFATGISNSVLEHIEAVDLVLSETYRVLDNGATFLFTVPNPRYLAVLSIAIGLRKLRMAAFADHYTRWFKHITRVYHADMPDVWIPRLEHCGFRVERWWHYFPPSSHWVLEWGHFLGAPSLVAKWLTGKWILSKHRWNLYLTEKLVEPFARPVASDAGVFTFYVARKPE